MDQPHSSKDSSPQTLSTKPRLEERMFSGKERVSVGDGRDQEGIGPLVFGVGVG